MRIKLLNEELEDNYIRIIESSDFQKEFIENVLGCETVPFYGHTERAVFAEMYEKKEFEMGSFTYVGTIMNKKKLLEAGLPNKDYFIYWDDLEHGIRMRKAGKIIGVPGIVAYHDVGEEGSGINWKLYYSYRNMIDTYRKHFSGVCYDYFCLKIRVKIFLNHMTGHKKLELNILEEAFKNARQQKFGLHPVYRPGWKPGE